MAVLYLAHYYYAAITSFWGRGKFDGENLSDNGSGDNSGYFFRKTEKIG